MIDYGLAKSYKDPKTRAHIPFREGKKLTGTARYASIYTHMGYEQGRRDDLECLGYVLVYLAKGQLPWQGLRAPTKEKRYENVMLKKKGIPVETLCKGLPVEFAQYIHYSQAIKFDDTPDYKRLRKLFTDLAQRQQYRRTFDYDWNRLGIDVRKVKCALKLTDEDGPEEPSPHFRNVQAQRGDRNERPPESSPQRKGTTHSAGIFKLQQSAENKEEDAKEEKQAAAIVKTQTILVRSMATFNMDKRRARRGQEDSCNFEAEDIIEDTGLFGSHLKDKECRGDHSG